MQRETLKEELEDSALQIGNNMSSESHYSDYSFGDFPKISPIQPLVNKKVEHKELATPLAVDLGPIVSPEDEALIKELYATNPQLQPLPPPISHCDYTKGPDVYYAEEAWIQTYSGRRFTPTKPHIDSIVIQDIAHALSMQCRFSGHIKKFYSVAQHSVLVSYLCNNEDALWGLLHDASEAYLVDVPMPLKRSGKFDAYLGFEANMQLAICKRFGLSEKEPPSVKVADKLMLATEARDLLGKARSDWKIDVQPVPFKIDPLDPQKAKDLFMKRFFELTNNSKEYQEYLKGKNRY